MYNVKYNSNLDYCSLTDWSIGFYNIVSVFSEN